MLVKLAREQKYSRGTCSSKQNGSLDTLTNKLVPGVFSLRPKFLHKFWPLACFSLVPPPGVLMFLQTLNLHVGCGGKGNSVGRACAFTAQARLNDITLQNNNSKKCIQRIKAKQKRRRGNWENVAMSISHTLVVLLKRWSFSMLEIIILFLFMWKLSNFIIYDTNNEKNGNMRISNLF